MVCRNNGFVGYRKDWLHCNVKYVPKNATRRKPGPVRMRQEIGEDEIPENPAEEAVNTSGSQGVLTSSRLGMPCDEETKYIALMYGPWGFQKCIWES